MNEGINQSPLAYIDTKLLLFGFLVTIIVSMWIAYRYRNSYNVRPMLKMYGIFAIVFIVFFLMMKVKIVIIIGTLLMGLVILGFRSNYYFYH